MEKDTALSGTFLAYFLSIKRRLGFVYNLPRDKRHKAIESSEKGGRVFEGKNLFRKANHD